MREKELTHKGPARGQYVLAFILGLFTLFCFLPVLLVVIVSFSSEASVAAKGFSFFPTEWSTKAYDYVLKFGRQLLVSYGVTTFVDVFGTLLSLWLTSMFAYSLSRKNFNWRNGLSVYLLITMLFSGGTLGGYLINTNVFHLKNTLWVLILPGCITTMNVIVMRTLINTNVPDSLVEAAKIDGASDYRLFFVIIVPIMAPVLAALGFMTAIGHWNQWMTSYLYITKSELTTLQHMLMKIEKNLDFLKEQLAQGQLSPEQIEEFKNAPSETARMAMLFCTLGPVLVVYPFFQRFFIKGMTVGAVKG